MVTEVTGDFEKVTEIFDGIICDGCIENILKTMATVIKELPRVAQLVKDTVDEVQAVVQKYSGLPSFRPLSKVVRGLSALCNELVSDVLNMIKV